MPELQLLFDYENIKPSLFSKCEIDDKVSQLLFISRKTCQNHSVKIRRKTNVVSGLNNRKIGPIFAQQSSSGALLMLR